MNYASTLPFYTTKNDLLNKRSFSFTYKNPLIFQKTHSVLCGISTFLCNYIGVAEASKGRSLYLSG